VLDRSVGVARTKLAEQRRPVTRREANAPRRWTAGAALAAGLVLGACAIPFGSQSDSDPSNPESSRDRNRLYLQEQQRMERERVFDRVGPSDR
jgi:hypothetical protein